MKELPYESNGKGKGTIKCPYRKYKHTNNTIYIGSVACWKCEFCKKVDRERKTVQCLHEPKKGEIEIDDLF